ncbi:MAG TPA: hypothetical protein VFZ28_13875 [Burkholderiaceae bacterium]|nr:hypothetical protein [Burkholderiaceae bacterium]
MNALSEHVMVSEPRWRDGGFLQSLGPGFGNELPEGDFAETQRLLKVLQRPFDEQPEHEADTGFPPQWAQQIAVSCSS